MEHYSREAGRAPPGWAGKVSQGHTKVLNREAEEGPGSHTGGPLPLTAPIQDLPDEIIRVVLQEFPQSAVLRGTPKS
jgi:hypothetical protein